LTRALLAPPPSEAGPGQIPSRRDLWDPSLPVISPEVQGLLGMFSGSKYIQGFVSLGFVNGCKSQVIVAEARRYDPIVGA